MLSSLATTVQTPRKCSRPDRPFRTSASVPGSRSMSAPRSAACSFAGCRDTFPGRRGTKTASAPAAFKSRTICVQGAGILCEIFVWAKLGGVHEDRCHDRPVRLFGHRPCACRTREAWPSCSRAHRGDEGGQRLVCKSRLRTRETPWIVCKTFHDRCPCPMLYRASRSGVSGGRFRQFRQQLADEFLVVGGEGRRVRFRPGVRARSRRWCIRGWGTSIPGVASTKSP